MTEFILLIFLTVSSEGHDTALNKPYPRTFVSREECIAMTVDTTARTHLYRYLTEQIIGTQTIVDMRFSCLPVTKKSANG